ncbi:MAG: hypothetical protein NZ735_07255, partial [Candidatus Marinimicrobia bacterium]|nr:hypothetical protein [Candidatus Neomarinimicrobiota bacterium]
MKALSVSKVTLLLLIVFFWSSNICYGSDPIKELIHGRLSADKKTLDLSGTNIGTRGAKVLAGMSLLLNVETLLLQGNKIKYAGMKSLAKSPHSVNLKHLDLWGNMIGDMGLK